MSALLSTVVTVTTAGTIVQVSTTDLFCESFMVEPLHTNTGRTWVGGSNMVKATPVGVWAWIPAPSANIAPSFQVKGHFTEAFNLKDMYIDTDTSGEKAIITYLQR